MHDLPLELIEEDQMSASIDSAIRSLLCDCFAKDAQAFASCRAWHESNPTYSLIDREGDSVFGHVAVVVRTITCGNTPVTVAGVQSLAVAGEKRGIGLSRQLMAAAMDEAARRGIRFGLLFCEAGLERFYSSLGWIRVRGCAVMRDTTGRSLPIPATNLALYKELTGEPLPEGHIDLRGRDW